jgi:cell division protein FtsN
MSFFRVSAIAALSFLLLSGCGKKKEESAPVKEKAASEELFDQFFEDTSEEVSEADLPESDIAEPAEKAAVEPNFTPDGRYVVQVSCIASEDIAEDVAKKFENKGFPVYIAEVKNPTPQLIGTYYRIRIGGFNGIASAKSFGESSLLSNGYEYWIDNRSNDNVGIGDFGLGEDDGGFTYEEETPASTPTPVEESTFEPEPVIEEPAPVAQEIIEPVVETPTPVEVAPVVEEVAPVEEPVIEAPVVESEPVVEDAPDIEVDDDTADEWGTSDW